MIVLYNENNVLPINGNGEGGINKQTKRIIGNGRINEFILCTSRYIYGNQNYGILCGD